VTFTEANTFEAHQRNLLARATSARPVQLPISLGRYNIQDNLEGQA
jgi:hypothetical protein